MGERIVTASDVKLCTESFGDPTAPAILLIMGACASMVWWPEEFCKRIAKAGRHVVRYDHRDTGRSTTYQPGTTNYTLDDMATDALSILDAYELKRAHVIGASLGGMIGQILALDVPERVASMTLIMSRAIGHENPSLPPIDPKVLEYHSRAASIDWSDKNAVIEFMVGGWRTTAGTGHPFDEETVRAMAEQEIKRATNLLSMFNHSCLTGGESYDGKLNKITAPTLVIHGTEDPVLPYPHAVFLSKAIPGAKLLTLQGAGHELNRNDWDKMVTMILQHTV